MHETAIAQAMVETVLREAAQAGAVRVEAVEVEIGDLTFLGTDQLRFWVESQVQGTVAAQATWTFHRIPGALRCPTCGHQGPIETQETEDHFTLPVYACPRCGAADVEITQGRDAWIKAIHVEVA